MDDREEDQIAVMGTTPESTSENQLIVCYLAMSSTILYQQTKRK